MFKKAGLAEYVKRLNPGHLVVMTSLLLLCTTLEYYLHIIVGISGAYPHLFYVPLFIAAFWWGFGGGLSVGIFLGVMHATSYLPQISQIVLAESLAFALVGSATGIIGSERIRAEKKLQETFEKEFGDEKRCLTITSNNRKEKEIAVECLMLDICFSFYFKII